MTHGKEIKLVGNTSDFQFPILLPLQEILFSVANLTVGLAHKMWSSFILNSGWIQIG